MTKIPNSWPFQEAAKINLKGLGPGEKIVFETGFGPSGRPHVGTFAEVARTIMVMNAFRELNPGRADDATLYAFCDDMDGLRKVPGNVPEKEMLAERLGMPLYKIPDPFGVDESYSAHMERELEEFLGRFGFEFKLISSASEYCSGAFNPGLKRVMEKYDEIRAIILPTLQEENREGWSPIIPTCENCGRLYTTVVTGTDRENARVSYSCSGSFAGGKVRGCGHSGETSVLDGAVKVGWKVDWALRWYVYKVRYEMYGKDLIDSARLSGKICRVMGGDPPAGMVYELFLDETGKKISKSVGEGLTVDSWMTYAPIESLIYFLFQNPRKQRRLYFDMVPKMVDDLLAEYAKYPDLEEIEKPKTVSWHMEKIGRERPAFSAAVNFSTLLNLISALGAGERELLWDYVRRYDPGAEGSREVVDKMVDRAVKYYMDFVEPAKKYRAPEPEERLALESLLEKLEAAHDGLAEDEYQALVFETAKERDLEAKALFKTIYEVLLGQERGPRFGTFVKLVGKPRAAGIIKDKLA